MQEFSVRLKEYGLYADVICIENFYYERFSSIKWPSISETGFNYLMKLRSGLLSRALRKLCVRFFTKLLIRKYEVIDFHSYYPSYYNFLMCYCQRKGIKFDITLWGSDLMRADSKRKELMKYGFNHCYRLKLTESLLDLLKASYGDVYTEKSRIVYFGNSDIPVIDGINDAELYNIQLRLYGDVSNKRLVVFGYNGMMSQNHIMLIKSLDSLSDSEKNSIHIVLPMTYGATNDYLNQIKMEMDKSSVSYTILSHFLDPKEVAVVRKSAQIVVNVQTTDALAGSLQDHLYCGNVCIFGEWLNYAPYVNNGIFYIKTSMSKIATHLQEVLHNYHSYQSLCKDNSSKIKRLFSWESIINRQVEVYGE